MVLKLKTGAVAANAVFASLPCAGRVLVGEAGWPGEDAMRISGGMAGSPVG